MSAPAVIGLTQHLALRRSREAARPMRASRMAIGLVNTSTPNVATEDDLRAALRDPAAPAHAQARILLEEASQGLLADLVREGFVGWQELEQAVERYAPANHETAAWIRDMARLALARAAGTGH